MIKRKAALFSLVLAIAMVLSVGVSALIPGDELEEIKTTQPVKIDTTSPGKPVDVMDDVSGVSVVVSANVLPEGVTSVALETATLKKEVATVAMKEVVTMVTTALNTSNNISDHVSKESEQVVKNYNVKAVSAIVLNLIDKTDANSKEKTVITELKKAVDFTVPVAKGVNAIAYVDPKTGKLVIIEGKFKNGFLTFSTKVTGVQFVLLELTKKK